MDAIFDADQLRGRAQQRRARRSSGPRRDPRRGLRAAARAARHGGRSSSARSAPATTTSTCSRTRTAGSGSACTSARAASATGPRRGFLALAQGQAFEDHATEGEMDSPPVAVRASTASSGSPTSPRCTWRASTPTRGVTRSSAKVLEILGARGDLGGPQPPQLRLAREPRRRPTCGWSARAARRRSPARTGFVGATMGEPSVILRGVESAGVARPRCTGPCTAPGGSMSRTQAAGKSRRRWACRERDCDWVKCRRAPARAARCPRHPDGAGWSSARSQSRPGRDRLRGGAGDLERAGIELRGGGADEAPEAYKRLDAVLADARRHDRGPPPPARRSASRWPARGPSIRTRTSAMRGASHHALRLKATTGIEPV